jgi:hypothetical protein
MYWLLRRKSKLSRSNKRLIYKTILKPIWTYGIHLWGRASTSNIGILKRFHSNVGAWYWKRLGTCRIQLSEVVSKHLQLKKNCSYNSLYSTRLSANPNDLVVDLVAQPNNKRLRRHLPNVLPTTFLV